MPPPFERITLQEFADLLRAFTFTRRINAVHMHHTWRPNHSQYRGHDTIVGMWRHHTQTNGWSDIAQHITIAPDGDIWLGRSWNHPPASANGHNGNARVGPFMFEMIGDFDVGRDAFKDPQRDVVLRVVALVQKRFGLLPETLAFHRSMSSKTCPGSGIDYDEVLREVRRLHAEYEKEPPRRKKPQKATPFGPESVIDIGEERIKELAHELLTRNGVRVGENLAEAEPAEEEDLSLQDPTRGGPGARDGERDLSPERLAELHPHVINLRQGLFSTDGRISTAPEDVDAIFEHYLVEEVRAAKARGETLHVVFYAHGGLTSESNALRMADAHIRWWKRNHVYPIYFIWETGFFETIRQLLFASRRGIRRATKRDLWDVTTDPVIEAVARSLGGQTIWSGMKQSARRASDADGGARYAARQLAAFLGEHEKDVVLHAVGHSAGSNFLSYFIPAAVEEGVKAFSTVHFMAPAIRADAFRQRLEKHVGEKKAVKHLTVFTMKKALERADHCARIYRKSLLYLIHHALEPERGAPILGLDASLRQDRTLRTLFGLSGQPSKHGEVVWSTTALGAGRSASHSVTHGGFDNDAPTLNSILRRILGTDDNDPIHEYAAGTRGQDLLSWDDQVDWPEELAWFYDASWLYDDPSAVGGYDGSYATPSAGQPSSAAPDAGGGAGGGSGRRRALCVGIDDYSSAPLSGCVADARLWSTTLAQLGFTSEMLLNDQATREAILDGLRHLVTTSRAGDVVVFQFAGHGTQLPDLDGDEQGGDTPGSDEALCPHDYPSGAFVIDDDVADVVAQTPEGVNVTCFIDCCHSGTITRFGVGAAQDGRRGRARFLAATPEMVGAHQAFRAQQGRSAPGTSTRGPESMHEVVFSACLSSEVAYEVGGQGEFTRRASQVLRDGFGTLTNEAFATQVLQAFGASPRQHPQLDCAPGARGRGLLQPLTAAQPTGGRAVSASAYVEANGSLSTNDKVARLLRSLADSLGD